MAADGPSTAAAKVKMLKSCDECKNRKVKCYSTGIDGAKACANCLRRNSECHFSPLKKPRRRGRRANALPVETANPHQPETDSQKEVDVEGKNEIVLAERIVPTKTALRMPKFDGLQELCIDRMLADTSPDWQDQTQRICLQGLGVFGNEYSLTFFSEPRLATLYARLGHDKVSKLVENIAAIVSERIKAIERVPSPPADVDRSRVLGADTVLIAACIKSYFEEVHPVYTFLSRSAFEALAFSPQTGHLLATDKSFAALYYAVLALGCQYNDGGSFLPGKNLAWRFFATSLALFPDLLITKATLTTVQAITAMAIYASTISCMQFEYVMVSEGAKKAQSLGYNRTPTPGDDPRNRVFWVLYCLEKTMSFTSGRSSVLMDSNISCAVAPTPLPQFGSFDWSLAFIRHARLLSRIHTSLYSVSAAGQPKQFYTETLKHLKEELEAWRMSIPLMIRPGETVRPHLLPSPSMIHICLRVNYLYYNTLMTLNRTDLQLEVDAPCTSTASSAAYHASADAPTNNTTPSHHVTDGSLNPPSRTDTPASSMPNTSNTSMANSPSHVPASTPQLATSTKVTALSHTARSILDLTKYIEVAPHTPLWILAAIPLSALLVLFDLVIDNPTHPETSNNLALLDVGAGHFSRMEYESKGTVPGSITSEFARIARGYVEDRVGEERRKVAEESKGKEKEREEVFNRDGGVAQTEGQSMGESRGMNSAMGVGMVHATAYGQGQAPGNMWQSPDVQRGGLSVSANMGTLAPGVANGGQRVGEEWMNSGPQMQRPYEPSSLLGQPMPRDYGGYGIGDGMTGGTDIMDLFGSFMPSVDDMLGITNNIGPYREG